MKRVRKESPSISAIALAVALAVTASVAMAQGKPGNPGNKPPGGETAVNNLSYPAIEINNAGPVSSAFFQVTTSPGDLPGTTFSYGCPDPAYPATAEFPNFSCVNDAGNVFYSPEQCVLTGMPCYGNAPADLDRIYWQKQTANDWSADSIAAALGVDATHVDWGDNLETQTWWTTAAIRVETTTFGQGRLEPKQRGLQMWHVSGKGQTELWGVRARASDSLPYVYDAVSAILHTTAARLNIAKMSGPGTCPPAAGALPPPGQGNWTYSTSGGSWINALLINGKRYLYDTPYTPELNIGGRYVHGFNWQLRNDNVPVDPGKSGWWRLTFYSNVEGASPAVMFTGSTLTVAPDSVPAMPTLLSLTAAAAAEADTGPLYKPVVVPGFNLSYIDICISEAKGGGSKKPR